MKITGITAREFGHEETRHRQKKILPQHTRWAGHKNKGRFFNPGTRFIHSTEMVFSLATSTLVPGQFLVTFRSFVCLTTTTIWRYLKGTIFHLLRAVKTSSTYLGRLTSNGSIPLLGSRTQRREYETGRWKPLSHS